MSTKFTMPPIKVLLIALIFAFGKYYSQGTNGAVGINTTTPNANSVLDIVSGNNNKGIFIPRLTEAQRNAIVINTSQDDGLTVYNTTEDCLNYWSLADNEWKSVCGQMGKSVFTVDCSNSKAMGSYVKGKDLTNSNYLSIAVNVTKIGNYTITGTTSNGYNFYGTGVFLNTGTQTVQVPGQGNPQNVQTDNIAIDANGTEVTCTPAVSVSVLSPSGTYTMSCGSATVNGVYKVGTALTSSNTITLPVNVSALGSYTITTNTVDGISFSGSGTFTSTGNQNITLNGSGTPSSTSVKKMTITSDSQGGVSTTCSVNVIVVISGKKIIGIGVYGGTYGYHMESSASSAMYNAAANFGTLSTSTIKYDNTTAAYTNYSSDPSDANFSTWLAAKPDIVIIGYYMNWSVNKARAMADYLNSKGTCILMQQDPNNAATFFQTFYGDNSITFNSTFGGGSIYQLSSVNDAILNGPFGDIRGKYWGEDAGGGSYITNAPLGSITTYSTAVPITSNNTNVGVSSFRDNTHNFIFIGDGGFTSNPNNTTGAAGNGSQTICPFAVDAAGKPIARTGYGNGGNGTSAGGYTVYNSILFANALAWAIQQAEFNGINTQ